MAVAAPAGLGSHRGMKIDYHWIGPERAHAPLLVFLHEGLGSIAMWRDFPRQLCEAGGFRGFVYSRPGYGRSAPRPPDERWTPAFMHEQAHEVLPRLLASVGIDEPVWLFGHSDGGSIALLHAARFPDRVRGAIVLAPHLFVEDLSVDSIAKVRTAYLETDLRAKLARYHDDVDSAFWGWNDIWLDPAFRAWNIEAEVARIRSPVLAVQGVNDEYGTMRQIERIAELVPGAEVLKLEECGHSPHKDQPVRVIAAAVDWIRRHG
jgi:pimeloyl-ACP methyl ester carboxylesterase